jgi:hypothetical protein
MDPAYKERVDEMGRQPRAAIPTKVPAVFREMIDLIAYEEDDDMSNLVTEGVMRVIDDRLSDPGYQEQLENTQREIIAEAEERLERIPKILGKYQEIAGQAEPESEEEEESDEEPDEESEEESEEEPDEETGEGEEYEDDAEEEEESDKETDDENQNGDEEQDSGGRERTGRIAGVLHRQKDR